MERTEDPPGATPLDDEAKRGLRLSWVATREDLNRAEASNILDAAQRWQARPLTLEGLLDDQAVRDLHKDMFGGVWAWAGKYRDRDLNIGIQFERVPVSVRDLVDDAGYWFSEDSLRAAGARFHHRLVQIHPFLNGNGRHSRLLTDLLIESQGGEAFTWGSGDLVGTSRARTRYIEALRSADRGDPDPLIEFVYS